MTYRPVAAPLPDWIGATFLALGTQELAHDAVLWCVRRGGVAHFRIVPIAELEPELAAYVRGEDAKLTVIERAIRKWIFATDEDAPEGADVVVTFALRPFETRIPVVNGRILWPKPS